MITRTKLKVLGDDKVNVSLTKDQVKFLTDMLYDNVVCSATKQPQARRGFAIRVLNALGDNYNENVDHSSADIINAKLKSGELKLPKERKTCARCFSTNKFEALRCYNCNLKIDKPSPRVS